MTDIDTLVETAQAKGTFSVLDAAKGRAYPEDDTTVYLDSAAAYEFHAIETALADEKDAKTKAALDKKRTALKAKVEASALTFHLRGVAPGFVQALLTKATALFPPTNDENQDYPENAAQRVRWFENALWVEHIVSATNAAGEVDEHRWTVDEIEELRNLIPGETEEKIMELVNNLSFAAAYFDAVVSADF